MPAGRSCKFYLNSGTYASPTWNLIDFIKDVTQTSAVEEITNPTRASKFTPSYHGGISWAITATLDHKPANTHFNTLRNAANSGAEVEIRILDNLDSVNGADGYRATCHVFQFDENQPLAGPVDHPIKFAPSGTRDPERVTIVI